MEFYLCSFHTHFLKLLHEQSQPLGERERDKNDKQHLGTERVLSGKAVKTQKEKHHMPNLNKYEGHSCHL